MLHYLKGSPRKEILFRKSNRLLLETYTSANYTRSVVDIKSTSSYCTFLKSNLVT